MKKENNLMEKLFLGIFAGFTCVIIAVTILSSTFLRQFTTLIHQNAEQRLKNAAELAAKTITTAEELDKYQTLEDLEDTDKNEAYEALRAKMQAFAAEHDLLYVYFMRQTGDWEEQMIIDSDSEEPLQLDYFEDMNEETHIAFTEKRSVSMNVGDYVPAWEGIIGAYAPVFYEGTDIVAAIVGVDLYDVQIVSVSALSKTFTYIFMVCAAFLVISASALLFLFRRKAHDYQKASVAKSEFLSRMSHEIRTPMNAIIGFSRMAEKASDINEVGPYLKQISESSAFLLELINGILDISKIEAGKMHLSKKAVSPLEIMENIQSMLQNQAVAKNINLIFSKEGEIPGYIYCDATHLTQVLLNLLSNALKFTNKGGRIVLSIKLLERSEGRCCLEFAVEDNGIGINKEFLLKIFEAFEQEDGGKTRKYTGTGLGLNISQLLVRLMGGEIKVESEEGKGSRFWFSIWFDMAAKEDAPYERKRIPGGKKTVDLTGKTVLIFEDNEINRIIAGNSLNELGANVEFAENGRVGVEMYLSTPEKYHMIFMDIQMPEMDGYQATRRIRSSGCSNAKSIPVIAMSADTFREDVEASLESGMDAHIGKPFEQEQVVSTIYDVINKNRI